MGDQGLSNTVEFGTTQVSLPNDISFHPTALAGCMSVTDDRPCCGNICCNGQNLFQWCCLERV